MNTHNGRYILNDGIPTPCPDLIEWGTWMETDARILRRTELTTSSGEVRVSTVFLGLDHSFHQNAEPVLFETMVFGGPFDGQCLRRETMGQAIEDHEIIVRELNNINKDGG